MTTGKGPTGVFPRRPRRLAAAAGAGVRPAAPGEGTAPLPGRRAGRSALTSLLAAYPGARPGLSRGPSRPSRPSQPTPSLSRPIPGPVPPVPPIPAYTQPIPAYPGARPGLSRGPSRPSRPIPGAYPGARPAHPGLPPAYPGLSWDPSWPILWRTPAYPGSRPCLSRPLPGARHGSARRTQVSPKLLLKKIKKLKKENGKLSAEKRALKNELAGLDKDFFEEVEDLKQAVQESVKLNNEYEKCLKQISVIYGFPFTAHL
ncbi:basic proline-rich protein-like isoform X1 [Vidua chalybeata]|uniref:basic proline-rich protein-like isoform X1 n=1 Tax=Vidua chalybeata TaxID=81927 RepID=UPI0023A90BA7|nr:basic proline-rich protein-like isoform X1 [Vidua chalybeata]